MAAVCKTIRLREQHFVVLLSQKYMYMYIHWRSFLPLTKFEDTIVFVFFGQKYI